MTRNRILSMLVLLVMAVTGAWAQEQSETITTTDYIVEGTHFTISTSEDTYVDRDGMCADKGITVTSKNGETITKVVISCTIGPDLVNDGNTSVSSGTMEITNGGGTITVTGVNASVFTFTCSDSSPQFGQFVVYYTEASAGPTCYTVSMKEGTEDATSWTIAPPEATTTGVAQGTEVTATYSGTKKVKSVKAKKKAATAPAAAIAPALMDGATVVIECNCDGFVTYFTFTNNGGTYSCDNITGDESDYFSASLTKQGNTLVFVAQHSDMPDSFDNTINFDTTSDTYSFAKKAQDLFYFKISVNGTDITDKLSETAPAAAYTMAAAATSADKGKLICADGHIHANGADAACTKARVAKIIYIGTTGHATYSHGLALALTDEGQMAWGAAMTACNTTKNTNTPVTDATWLLASKDQWNYMKGINGAGSASALRTGFEDVSGTNMVVDEYWSSTEDEDDCMWVLDFNMGVWNSCEMSGIRYVRACLAF